MPLRKLFLVAAVAAVLTLNAGAVLAQEKSGATWSFSCRKWEERKWSDCGDSPFDLTRKFLIGHSEGTPVGHLTIVNQTNQRRVLEYVEISPAYDADDLQQPYWFTGLGKENLIAEPGRKYKLTLHFIGRRKASKSYAHRPWVSPGVHEGTMKLRDKVTGEIYEFKISVHAHTAS